MGKPLVLVVEDDPEIREVVAEILEWDGYRVATTSNGREALHAVATTAASEAIPPALMLLDMQLPILDGWGVARALRDQGFQIPIVVMTDALNARSWAQAIGAAGYLPKPFGMTDLLTTIADVHGQLAAENLDVARPDEGPEGAPSD